MNSYILTYKTIMRLKPKENSIFYYYDFLTQEKKRFKASFNLEEIFQNLSLRQDQNLPPGIKFISGDAEKYFALKNKGADINLILFCYQPKEFWVRKFLGEYFPKINAKPDLQTVTTGFEQFLLAKQNEEDLNIQWYSFLSLSDFPANISPLSLSQNGQWLLIQENLLQSAFLAVENLEEKSRALFNYIFGIELDKTEPASKPENNSQKHIISALLNNPQLETLLSRDMLLYKFSRHYTTRLHQQMEKNLREDWLLQQRELNLYPEDRINAEVFRFQQEPKSKLKKLFFRLFPLGKPAGDLAQKLYLKTKPLFVTQQIEIPLIENHCETFTDIHTDAPEPTLDIAVLVSPDNGPEEILYYQNWFQENFPQTCRLWFVIQEVNEALTSIPEENIWGISQNGTFQQFLQNVSADYIGFLKSEMIPQRDFYARFLETASKKGENSLYDLYYFDLGYKNQNPGENTYWIRPDTISSTMLLSEDFYSPAIINRETLTNLPEFTTLDFPFSKSKEWKLSLAFSNWKEIKARHLPYVLCEIVQKSEKNTSEHEKIEQNLKKHLEAKGVQNIKITRKDNAALHYQWDYHPGKISIIIPTRNNLYYIYRLVKNILFESSYKNIEVILVDNGSRFRKFAEKNPLVNKVYKRFTSSSKLTIIPYDEPFNYSHANNLGAERASGLFYLFMNNDMLPLNPDWIEELLYWASLPHVGIVSGKLLYPNKKIQAFGTVVGMHGHAGHVFQGLPENSETIYGSTSWYWNSSTVTGACMMMKHSLFKRIGGFNEDYRLAFSDVEFCLQARALGLENVCTPNSRIIHYEGASRSKFIPYQDLYLGLRRLAPEIESGDEYYPQNLSLLNTAPSLKMAGEPDPSTIILNRMAFIPRD